MSDSLEEFRDDFSNAPFDLEEIAQEAIEIEDCDDLVHTAQAFLDAKLEFENALSSHNFIIG